MIAYFIRTDSLKFEARGEKFCNHLKNYAHDTLMVAIVKETFNVPYEAIQKVVDVGNKFIPLWARHMIKLIAIQYLFFKIFYKRNKQISHIVIGNFEFLPAALILALFVRIPIFVDLHEHYFTKIFIHPCFANFIFTKWLDGVIFANQARADDLLGKYSDGEKVSIIRNFPDIKAGSIVLDNFQESQKIKFAIVGNIAPGRFIEESIESLDVTDFSSEIEIHLFGRFPHLEVSNIALINHGAFNHDEIDDLLKSVDVSLIFYDRNYNKNFFFCEPNRFFQAYNAGNEIICFDHPSLSEFYDASTWVINEENFKNELFQVVKSLIKKLRNDDISKKCRRELLTYVEGIKGLKWLE